VAFYVVGVVEVVAQIVLGEVEGDEETCVVGGERGRACEGYGEFGTVGTSVWFRMGKRWSHR
jgi:hypothetical protein